MKLWILMTLVVVVTACTSAPATLVANSIPEVTAAEFRETLAASPKPMVVNVWASWCLPCRAEAPLLREASRQFSDEVTFLGVDVQDRPDEAAAFVAEFGLNFEHVADPDRSIPAELGGTGVPITYFVAAGGEITSMHIGIIDERTLVSGINQLLSQP